MSLDTFADIVLLLAVLPLVIGITNMFLYRPLAPAKGKGPALSVLIPARNEEARIRPVIASVLENTGADFELIIADDSSTDQTPDIVREIASRDNRVRLITTPALPEGWSGKTHACYALSKEAAHDVLVFIDADVTVSADALARIATYMGRNVETALLSGFPRQLTGSFWERLVIPLIHTLLLGYLPMSGLRYTKVAMFGAACGQLMVVRRAAYEATGGHAKIPLSLHDGVTLPRLFRSAGYSSDLFDATGLSATRMYETAGELWRGFSKNAHEGMATWIALPIWTVLLAGGHIAPLALFLWLVATGTEQSLQMQALTATACAFGVRALFAVIYRQSLLGVLLHPLGVAYLLALQWVALIRRSSGRSVSWRDRSYDAETGAASDG